MRLGASAKSVKAKSSALAKLLTRQQLLPLGRPVPRPWIALRLCRTADSRYQPNINPKRPMLLQA